MKLLGKYKNGNYFVKIYDDGTKIRYNNLDNLTAEFPECIDLNISNQCFHGCKYCYQNCTPNGKVADLDFLLNLAKQLHPYTELAVNVNDFNLHSDFILLPFLSKCRERKVIVNITINQDEYMKYHQIINDILSLDKEYYSNKEYDFSDAWHSLFWGVGISLTNPTDEFLNTIKSENIVIHTIAGVTSLDDYKKLYDKNLKVLILGYKNKGRGIKFNDLNNLEISNKINELANNLKDMASHFKVISFDNLAIEQLKLKELNLVPNWDQFYMGNDGQYTFYIDAVNQKYYKSSLELNGFGCENKTINEMFSHVKSL